MSNKDNEMDDWEAAMAEQAASEEGESEDNADKQSEGVRTAELEELNAESLDEGDKRKLDAILDIPVTISMEVGRSQISIRNLLQLNQGSVVELERVAGEPLDVL